MEDKIVTAENSVERMARIRALGVGARRKNPLEKLLEQPKSLRRAITAKCYDCIGRDGDPDWRGSIRNCGCMDCPLYAVRPYK